MANILGLLIKSMTVKNHSRSLRHFREKPQVKIEMTTLNLPNFSYYTSSHRNPDPFPFRQYFNRQCRTDIYSDERLKIKK